MTTAADLAFKSPLAQPEFCLARARRYINQRLQNRIAKALGISSAGDLSSLLRQELARYHGFVDDIARLQARDELTFDNGRLKVELPRCRAAEITVRHPFSPLAVKPILGRMPKPLYPMRDRDLDDFLHQLRAKLERKPEILYASATTLVFGITPWVVLKMTDGPDSEDVTNMTYVIGRVPEVPVPAVLGAFSGGGRHWVFMARAPGEPLDGVWNKLTPAQKLCVQGQLNKVFAALAGHRLPPQSPCPRLGSVAGGICKDARRRSQASQGSILTEREFNDFLCDAPDPKVKRWLRNIRATMRDDHRIVLTHGNLHPQNVLVVLEYPNVKGAPNGEIKVTAILGWEKAGWYPEHWEYVRAMSALAGPHDDALDDWVDYLPIEAIGCRTAEYALDCLLQDCIE